MSPSAAAAPSSSPPALKVGWNATGAMAYARNGPLAVVLLDGRVLIAGGCCMPSGYDFPTAELYDPVTRTWSFTGAMHRPRSAATMTRLADGRVLVVGGLFYSDAPGIELDSAEIYDPATGAWTATGNMTTPRHGHSATLLRNGMVLVTGGFTTGGYLSSSELFDPRSGTWSATGGMSVARGYHTATMLADGRVLVAGGCCDPSTADVLDATELYDPATRTWSLTGGMTRPRSQHTAVLLTNGLVLVAGGVSLSDIEAEASAELYDPRTGSWSATGSMATGRDSGTAVLLADGRVLELGAGTAEIYDPSSGLWTATTEMLEPRGVAAEVLLLDGSVLAAGGTGAGIGVTLASAELFLTGP